MNPFDLEKKIRDNPLVKVATGEGKEAKTVLNVLEEMLGIYKLWLIEPSGEEIGFVEVPKTIPIREGCLVRTTSNKFYKVISPPIFDEYESFSKNRDYYVIKVVAEKIEPIYS